MAVMTAARQPQAADARGRHLPMTAEQNQAFEDWWERFGQHYERAVIENGGTPWTNDKEERRALWARRHRRPEPPL